MHHCRRRCSSKRHRLCGTITMKLTPEIFFNTYSQYAINTQISHRVPASITLAQAALESAWGGSGLTDKANNFFGIKDSEKDEWYGEYHAIDTLEYKNGVPYTTNAKFRKYSSPQGSFND